MQTRAVDTLRRQGEKRRHLFSRSLFKRRTFDAKCVKFWLENSPRSCCMHREKHFYFKMLITFEPNVAQRSVASQNDHKSKACLPEASNTAFTMYRRLKRRLYEAPFLAPFFLAPHSSSFDSKGDTKFSSANKGRRRRCL